MSKPPGASRGKTTHLSTVRHKILMINAVVIFLWLVVAFLWHINRYIEKTPIDYRDIIIIVIGGIFITLNYFLIQVTFRPFEKLTETMNRVAGGDLKIRAEQTQGETHFIQEFEQAFNQMLDALEKERKHSQWLAGQVISAQEEERKRISRELHDETNQILVMLNIGLERLKISCAVCSKTDRNRQNMVEEADNLKDLSETALASLRNLAYHLRPSVLDDLGLKAALLWIARQHLEKQGIQVKFSWKIENERLPPEIEATFFRLAQEAISNIVKHSNARHVNLSFYSTQGSFVLEIRDDGIGFNLHEDSSFDGENKAHIGLLGMQERVKILSGKFEVVSSPGHGCHIKASIPVPGRVALLT